MKMKPKMLLGSTAISMAAVLFTTFGIVMVASNLAGESLQSELQNRLILQRDLKKDQITDYINSIVGEVAESADLDSIFSKAFIEFNAAFPALKNNLQISQNNIGSLLQAFILKSFPSVLMSEM